MDGKPEVQLTGENGNIFNLAAIASNALKRAGKQDAAEEMKRRVTDAGSYHAALAIICEYVDAS